MDPDGFDVDDSDADDWFDDEVEVAAEHDEPAAVPAERYKRRVEHRPPTLGGAGKRKARATVVILLAGIAGLLTWLQPWNSTPLEITSIQNERVELAEVPGVDVCFWRFDLGVANTSDERVWITGVELFLNDQIVRPTVSFGFIDPGIESAIPVEILLGNVGSTGTCLAVATVDHSPVDVIHAILGEVFTVSASF